MPYVDLQSAGIEFPASVVAELELAGVQIERCESALPGGQTVKAVRLPGAAEEAIGRPRSGAEGDTAMPQGPARRDWGEVRVYRGSLWLALETAWATVITNFL